MFRGWYTVDVLHGWGAIQLSAAWAKWCLNVLIYLVFTTIAFSKPKKENKTVAMVTGSTLPFNGSFFY